MIEQIEICNVAKETIELLRYFDSNFVSKISVDFLNFLRQLAEKSSITVTIDKNKKLKEQNVSEECKSLISLIYHNYIANEEEKKNIEKIWNENEQRYQRKLSEKYNYEDIFKKKLENNEEVSTNESLQLVKYEKHSFWTKILKNIKNLFKIDR